MSPSRTVVQVPYPAMAPDWTLRSLTCGVALQCAPSKDRVARHRLAEAMVAVESLEVALTAAREVPNSDTAPVKAIAGRAASTVARHCQQVLAGIGFTTEHSFHRFLKRVLALEGLFGSADAIDLMPHIVRLAICCFVILGLSVARFRKQIS